MAAQTGVTSQHSDNPTKAHTCNVTLRIAEVYHPNPDRLRVATLTRLVGRVTLRYTPAGGAIAPRVS